MKAEYQIGCGWGDSIQWQNPEEFDCDWGEKSRFAVYGFKSKRPQIGSTLMGEFVESYIKFEFISVDLKLDPKDMFFGIVKPIEQEMKA